MATSLFQLMKYVDPLVGESARHGASVGQRKESTMTYATQLNTNAAPRTGLARLWAELRESLRVSSEAAVRIAYDKPWLRDSRKLG